MVHDDGYGQVPDQPNFQKVEAEIILRIGD